ncbi:MAG: tol-pal system protein YbgF [Nitrospinota bacterium]
MARRWQVVLGTLGLGWALTVVGPGSVAAQDVAEALTGLRQEMRQVATAIAGARQDLVVVQRTQAQTKATVDELQTVVLMVDAKLEEFNHRLHALAQRLDALEAGGAFRQHAVAAAPPSAAPLGPTPAPPAPATPTPAAPAPTAQAAPPPAEPETAEALPPATAAPPPTPGTPLPQETVQVAMLDPREIFRAAHEDYVKGNYDMAILGFRDYLKKYPGTDLASSAQYWLGESYLGQEAYAQAVEEFQNLLDVYPQSSRVPSALYKQALAYLELGQVDNARTALEAVASQFPTTVEARHAAERLKDFSPPQ